MAVICYRSRQTVKSKQTLNISQLLVDCRVCKPLIRHTAAVCLGPASVSLLSCAAVMKPFKTTVQTGNVCTRSTVHVILVQSDTIFPLQFCVVPSCACAPCFCLKLSQKAVQYLFTQPLLLQRYGRLSSPP